jgi:DNA-binding transcriptional ArsR family regulator
LVDGELKSRLAALEERVGRLEGAPGPQRAAASADDFWALDVLRDRTGPAFPDAAATGSLVFAGTASLPGAGTTVWQEEHPVASVLAGGWADAAGALGALGHPVRLELIRRLLTGAHTTHELAEIPDLGTSGQLYHHLRELQAAGLVIQRRRNDYAVPADRVILCLVLVAAAKSCAHVREATS